jgi:hypothetical protein
VPKAGSRLVRSEQPDRDEVDRVDPLAADGDNLIRADGVESDQVLAPGKHTLRFEFEPTGQPDMAHGKGAPGRLQLYVDGTLTGNAEAPVTNPFVLNPGALTCGANPGSAVTDDYPSPFKFTGIIHSVTIDVSGQLIEDTEAELRMHMARQ